MKTSELIKHLESNLKENGDLEIDMHSDEAEDGGDFGGLATAMSDDDKPIGLTLCGPETLEAFA